MKKLIAMLLCFAMIAAFGATVAFAAMPDAKSANEYTEVARIELASLKYQEKKDKNVDKAYAILKEYEAVKYDSSKTKEQVDAARDKAAAKLAALNDPEFAFAPDAVSSASINTWKTQNYGAYKGWKLVALYKLEADKDDAWTTYWLSSGTKMDVNRRDITLAKLESAAQLDHAQEVAAAAKAGALKAQATAKVLIADSIKVAQDSAATAVANAQAAAYNTLAANYADAVEAFWGEVAAAWGF
nr:hypothetical protein [Clostridia bacterium]